MKAFLGVFLCLMSVGVVVACSNSSGGGSSTTNEFSSLPEVTGPVTTNGSLSVGSLATTGVSLDNPGAFGGGTSPQFCENINLLKEIMREASQPDKILCYMGAMRSSGVIPASLNITDGDVKYIRLTNLPAEKGSRENTRPVIKFQIIKTNGAISTFKMWSCFDGTPSAPVLSEYMSQVFSGGTATVITKNVGSEGTASYGSSMTTTGSFDNGWTSKNISGFRYYDDSGNSNVMEIDMDQYADQLRLSIAMDGRFGASTFTNRFFTVAQLLGSTLTEFAIGDGSSKVDMSYDQDSDTTPEFTSSNTFSWNGDTKINLGTASDGDYYATAHAGTVPAAPNSSQTVTFTGEEAWDCSLPSGETWTDANFNNGGTAIQTGMQQCNDKFLGDGGNWISCPY